MCRWVPDSNPGDWWNWCRCKTVELHYWLHLSCWTVICSCCRGRKGFHSSRVRRISFLLHDLPADPFHRFQRWASAVVDVTCRWYRTTRCTRSDLRPATRLPCTGAPWSFSVSCYRPKGEKKNRKFSDRISSCRKCHQHPFRFVRLQTYDCDFHFRSVSSWHFSLFLFFSF